MFSIMNKIQLLFGQRYFGPNFKYRMECTKKCHMSRNCLIFPDAAEGSLKRVFKYN